MASLQQAVSSFNTEQTMKMKDIESRRAEIQERHRREDIARTEALGKIEAARAEPGKEPSPVTWTTATKRVSARFGKEDPMGNIIVTPELAGMHRVAQKELVRLKKQGIEPLEAVNRAEEFARNIEEKYWEYVRNPERSKEQVKEFKKEFKNRYKYLPRIPSTRAARTIRGR